MNPTSSTRTAGIVGGAVVIGSVVLGLAAWPSLPDRMVVHWDAGGTPDGTASTAVGAFGLPALAAALLGVVLALPRIDPLGANVERFRGHYDAFVLLLVASLGAIHATVIAFNLGYEIDVGTVALGVVAPSSRTPASSCGSPNPTGSSGSGRRGPSRARRSGSEPTPSAGRCSSSPGS